MAVQALDPGAFPFRLTLERRVETQDGQGGVALDWALVANVWAHIKPLALTVTEEANGEVFRSTHEVWLHYRTDLESGMRFLRGARIFRINGWRDPDETRRYTVCRCEEAGG